MKKRSARAWRPGSRTTSGTPSAPGPSAGKSTRTCEAGLPWSPAPCGMGRDPMDAQQLRAIQTPLKERYRAEPAAALVTLHARGKLGEENPTCSVETGRALVEAGLHPATGGDGRAACSGDLLLDALVACAGVTMQEVVTPLALPLAGGAGSAA